MRTTAFALPFASLLLGLAACAANGPTDELAGETAEDLAGDGKADASADGTYTYFAIKSDLRRCAAPMCGGFFLERLNRTTTVCHDGSKDAACYAAELDWSEAGLNDQTRAQLVTAAGNGAIGEGIDAIVRGRFAPLAAASKQASVQGEPTYGRFIVTEAWVSESEAVADGVFVKAKDSGVRCITTPCSSIIEKNLNGSRSAAIAGIDFEPAGLSEASLSRVTNDMVASGGILIAGDRYTINENGSTAKGRTATAVFSRLVDRTDGECFIGGCSGQICSAEEGIITTCEWREEYACYQEATCERQADGQCGWTQTGELAACLGD